LVFRGNIEIGWFAEFSPTGWTLVTDWWDFKLRQWEAFPWRTDGDPRTDTDLAQVAWEGPHAFWCYPDVRIRMYHVVWDNPRPDQEIVSFDFASKLGTTAAPFLIAVTLE
jgi:hypothetical protein